ncbi:MAG: translation elongation factor Ts [Actinobacteria bacterium]|nr:translation elongation factor Ts [Actinomycetota bacterium]
MSDNERISANQVKELRDITGAGMMDCKRALEDAVGDTEKAVRMLREKGLARVKQRDDRVAEQGVIESYLHIGKQIGALVELNCETDFVARNEEFLELAHLVALQIAACNPGYLDRESVPGDVIDSKKEIYRELCVADGKRENELDPVIEGMLDKFYQEVCLLEQPFVKDPSQSVGELLAQTSAKVGEKLAIHRFNRFQVGEEQE